MRIVMQLSGRGTALFIQALASLKARLLNSVNKLRVSITQVSLSVGNLLNRLAKILLNFKVLLASLITAVRLIKVVLKRAVTINGRIGSQLLSIVRQTLQRVKARFKKGK
jgi:hypothetical protein